MSDRKAFLIQESDEVFSTPADRKSVELLRQLDVFRDISLMKAPGVDEHLHSGSSRKAR